MLIKKQIKKVADYIIRGVCENQRQALHEVKTWNSAIQAAAGKPFPVYILPDFSFSASPERGTLPHRCIITSIPKAGTYLLEKVVSEIGYKSTSLHLFSSSFTDYRFASMQQKREFPPELEIPLSLEDSLKFIQPGQFAVSHLACAEWEKKRLENYKTIYIYRNMRDCFASWFRFHIDTGRCGAELASVLRNTPENHEKIVQYTKAQEDMVRSFAFTARNASMWYYEDNTYKLSYEALNGDYGQDRQLQILDGLCDFLVAERIVEKEKFLRHVLNTDTLTWSGKRTNWEAYWSPEVEKIFNDMELSDINKIHGYE